MAGRRMLGPAQTQAQVDRFLPANRHARHHRATENHPDESRLARRRAQGKRVHGQARSMAANAAQNADVLVVNPKIVDTGLDYVEYKTKTNCVTVKRSNRN